MVVSGEAWRLFKEVHPGRDFSDFWVEVSLHFSINSFNLSTFFFFREDNSFAATTSNSSNGLKTEPLSPITIGLDFSYASDVVEDNSCDSGHVVDHPRDCGFPDVIVIIPVSKFLCN
jgi:hypothetical protein